MSMQVWIESALYQASQIFMLPILLAVMLMFVYAFYALGGFLWQSRQRRQGLAQAYDLVHHWRQDRHMSMNELETFAFKQLEAPRIVTRVTPMLGLVATMIPMGPALKSLSGGNLSQASDNLTVAFSAVILSLIAASLTYWVVNVRRRWYAEEMIEIERLRALPGAAAVKDGSAKGATAKEGTAKEITAKGSAAKDAAGRAAVMELAS